MTAFAVFLRRLRNALPGHTTASRLRRDISSWRSAPPSQRGAAFVQHHQTLRQLRQIHLQQKIAPKIVDLLFRFLTSRLGIFSALVLVGLIGLLVLKP